MRTFKNLEEMQPYQNNNTGAYVFIEDGKMLDIEITFDLTIDENIMARDIKAQKIEAWDIKARNIEACDIRAWNIRAQNIDVCNMRAWNINAGDIIALNIEARDISFYAVCVAYDKIVCNSIAGTRTNSRYFTLDGEVIIREDK